MGNFLKKRRGNFVNQRSFRKLSDTIQIGDGGLPNKYWVTISNDYCVQAEPGVLRWSGRSDVEMETFGPFDSYQEAMEVRNKLLGEITPPNIDGFHSIFIEDRISGEIHYDVYVEYPPTEPEYKLLTNELLDYTKEILGEDFK